MFKGRSTMQVFEGQCRALNPEPPAQAQHPTAGQRQQATPGQLRRVREALSAHVQAVCSAQQKLSSLEAAFAAAEAF
jgi:hypothetical protein